jgi:uncharacterized protein
MRRVGVGLVTVYRYTVGPLLATLGGGLAGTPRCKYHPSCSRYASDAFRSHGLVRGSVLAAWRLARCNPWSHGGVDRVEEQRLFRREA